MKYLYRLTFVLLTVSISSCFIGAGTHGSIKGYRYPIPKEDLEKAVMSVIRNNSTIIYRDTSANGTGYNDGKSYLTIKIIVPEKKSEFTFRYYGGEEEWKTSRTSSEIFICYAYDSFGQGGSEGNGNLNRQLRKKLTNIFETEFMSLLDKELNMTHVDQ